MADLTFSRQPVYLADSSNNIAGVINTTPSTEYGIVTRNIPSGTQAVSGTVTANAGTGPFPVSDNAGSLTVDAPVGTPVYVRISDGAANLIGQKAMTASLPVVLASDQSALAVSGTFWQATQPVSIAATVVVDTELPTAAALADGAANPTTPTEGSASLVFNGTTWDRVREVVNAQNTTGTGVPAAGFLGQFDDVATGAVTENQFAPVRISTRRALLVEGVASGTPLVGNITQIGGSALALGQTTMTASIPVTLASNQSALVVDTELPSAAALADATANPTTPSAGALLMGYNGTTWDRVRTANTGRLQVDVITGGGSNASVMVDNAAFTDGTSSVTATGYVFDEAAGTALTENDIAAARIDSKRAQVYVLEDATTRGQRLAISATGRASMDLTGVGGTAIAIGQAAMAASLPVTIASNQSALAVDTELPSAASLGDATANPTVPGVGGFLMGFNGTTWDRVRTANTGRLQVDVISGGGAPPASEVPSGYNALIVYGTTSATASGASASVTTNTPANTKTFYVRHITVSASGATKWQVKFGATVLATGFIPQALLTESIRFDPPLAGTGDGSTALTIDVTNREASAMDLYARMGAIVLA